MNNKRTIQPNRRHYTVLRQLCELIPTHLVAKLARETGVDLKERTFSCWSHVVAMIYAQISQAWSLNDVCDALRLHITSLFGRFRTGSCRESRMIPPMPPDFG